MCTNTTHIWISGDNAEKRNRWLSHWPHPQNSSLSSDSPSLPVTTQTSPLAKMKHLQYLSLCLYCSSGPPRGHRVWRESISLAVPGVFFLWLGGQRRSKALASALSEILQSERVLPPVQHQYRSSWRWQRGFTACPEIRNVSLRMQD